MAAIPVDMCENAVENFKSRLHRCIRYWGGGGPSFFRCRCQNSIHETTLCTRIKYNKSNCCVSRSFIQIAFQNCTAGFATPCVHLRICTQARNKHADSFVQQEDQNRRVTEDRVEIPYFNTRRHNRTRKIVKDVIRLTRFDTNKLPPGVYKCTVYTY